MASVFDSYRAMQVMGANPYIQSLAGQQFNQQSTDRGIYNTSVGLNIPMRMDAQTAFDMQMRQRQQDLAAQQQQWQQDFNQDQADFGNAMAMRGQQLNWLNTPTVQPEAIPYDLLKAEASGNTEDLHAPVYGGYFGGQAQAAANSLYGGGANIGAPGYASPMMGLYGGGDGSNGNPTGPRQITLENNLKRATANGLKRQSAGMDKWEGSIQNGGIWK